MSIYAEVMEKYQARRTGKQKTAFIAYLTREFPGLRVEKAGRMGSRNLIYGDIGSADVVFTAHYDTVNENLLPNLILPRRPLLRMLYMLLVISPMVALLLAVKYGMEALGAGEDISSICALAAYFAAFICTFIVGFPNRHNANDNTSGVLALMRLMRTMDEEKLSRTAFVFFDNEEYGCVGSGAFYKLHRDVMRDKLVVNMDCIGDGDNIMLVMSPEAEEKHGAAVRNAFRSGNGYTVELASSKKIKYSSDQKHFPVGIGVCALHINKLLGLWVGRIHTRRDTVCKKGNIEFICRCAEELIK